MGKTIDLDFLTDRGAREVARVRIAGEEYGVRSIDIFEDFIVVWGVVEEFMGELSENQAPRVEEVAAKREELLGKLHGMIGRLVPDAPAEVIRSEFRTLAQCRKVIEVLVHEIEDAAGLAVKKNSGSGRKGTKGTKGTEGAGDAV